MNYDYLNKVHEYWITEIFPHLSHHLTLSSFDDYLKRMAFLPSGKWLRDYDAVKLVRIPFACNPSEFVLKLKKHCVSYCCPAKPEDGIHRIIYQISPTLHVEAALTIWVDKNDVQSFISMFACFHDEKELIKFLEKMYEIRRTGDTEDRSKKSGFARFLEDKPMNENGLDKP